MTPGAAFYDATRRRLPWVCTCVTPTHAKFARLAEPQCSHCEHSTPTPVDAANAESGARGASDDIVVLNVPFLHDPSKHVRYEVVVRAKATCTICDGPMHDDDDGFVLHTGRPVCATCISKWRL